VRAMGLSTTRNYNENRYGRKSVDKRTAESSMLQAGQRSSGTEKHLQLLKEQSLPIPKKTPSQNRYTKPRTASPRRLDRLGISGFISTFREFPKRGSSPGVVSS
jgi:hypothetical protein